jgi:uncharacterized protein (DUF2147 family)
MIKRLFAFAAPAVRILPVLLGLVAFAPESWAARPEAGIWIDDTGQGAVEIYICADNANRLCGRIVWLKEPMNDEGVPKHDRHNPNPDLQARPICGLGILGNLGLMSDGTFDGGWIYDPKVGKSYSAAVQLTKPDTLVVTGYLAMKMLGKSFTWTRAPANLQRCAGAPPPA